MSSVFSWKTRKSGENGKNSALSRWFNAEKLVDFGLEIVHLRCIFNAEKLVEYWFKLSLKLFL